MSNDILIGEARLPRTEEQTKRNPYWHPFVKPHAIDQQEVLDLVLETLHIICASQSIHSYCSEDEEDNGSITPRLQKLHEERAEFILSKNLLKLSVYLRTLDDIHSKVTAYVELRDSFKNELGAFYKGGEVLTFRECCNKIIHAEDIRFVYDNNDEEGDNERWHLEGTLELEGHHRGNEWSISIFVPVFLEATLDLLAVLSVNHDV